MVTSGIFPLLDLAFMVFLGIILQRKSESQSYSAAFKVSTTRA